MKAAKRGSRNKIFKIEAVENDEGKVHLVMKNSYRLHKDGSLTQEAAGFYVYTKQLVIERYLPSGLLISR